MAHWRWPLRRGVATARRVLVWCLCGACVAGLRWELGCVPNMARRLGPVHRGPTFPKDSANSSFWMYAMASRATRSEMASYATNRPGGGELGRIFLFATIERCGTCETLNATGLMVEGGGTHGLTITLGMSGSCFCLSSTRTRDLLICRPKR